MKENSKELLFNIVETGGMSKEDFESCLSDKELETKILNNQISANKELKIKTTPSFLINGRLVEGNKSLETFRQVFDSILENL